MEYLLELVYIYNLMIYLLIGYMLYFFMFGCELVLFIDYLLGIFILDLDSIDKYFFNYKEKFGIVFNYVWKNLEENVERR